MSLAEIFSIKYGALALLVLQNSLLVVLMRYSRVSEGTLYASSTAVTNMELLKFVTCFAVIGWQAGSFSNFFRIIKEDFLSNPHEIMRLAVPSLVYVIQNNLLYYALSHLDAATYLVGYQVKILTTAVFSVTMLGKSITMLQWASLFILTVGVSMSQLSAQSNSKAHENTMSGFIAVLLAACLSGFAGVYFEKILKGSTTSLWMRNIQMGVSSLFLALTGVYFSGDYTQVSEKGFFYGYNSVVWSVIFLQAVGGLVVAVVVKYADNILKGFAASFSIITSCILCYFYFDFKPTLLFVAGAALVNLSIYLYSYVPPAVQKHSSILYSKSKTEQV